MTINPEIQAEILRLFHAEGWTRGTIASQLGVHHSTVSRVLASDGIVVPTVRKRSKLDPYMRFVHETLEKYPKLTASRLLQMVKERGYSGGPSHFRYLISKVRPKQKGEAFLRLNTLPGEEAQVDWGLFGKIKVGDAERRLLAFVMVLSWSRRIFVRFYLGDDIANFLHGHIAAFDHFGNVPRTCLYDNLKTAVIERVDSAIRFNPEFLRFSAHYRFGPKPVPVARPTSKGRVERAIQYVRTSFFAAREYENIEDLNRQVHAWCLSEALERRCGADKSLSVAEAFEKEKSSMLSLPATTYPVHERKMVQANKTPYIRFDLNDYSIPHNYVRKSLLVEATLDCVRVVDGIKVIAEHERSFDRGQLIENAEHLDALVAEKRTAHGQRAMSRILNVTPSAQTYFKMAAERGHNMGRLTQTLVSLLDLFGSSELETALNECISCGAIHSEAVRNVLERRRLAKGQPQPVPIRPLSNKHFDQKAVIPKSLQSYDQLINREETE